MALTTEFSRRGPLDRKLAEAGAIFDTQARAAVALEFGDPGAELEAARHLGLADLSVLPRTGFKGAGAPAWLTEQGLVLPKESNQATRQNGGEVAARLAPNEVLILGCLAGMKGSLPETLEASWAALPLPPAAPRGYPLPRRDSHGWFLVSGAQAPAMFAKLCGVDLSPGKFDDLAIAQTSIAGVSGIIIRDDRGEQLAYHLLCDSAFAIYLWDCLIDAMTEFNGRPVGLAAVRSLGNQSSGSDP